MKIDFRIKGKTYKLKKVSIQDYYKMQLETAVSETPGFYIASYLSGCPESDIRELNREQWEELWQVIQIYLADQNDATKPPAFYHTLDGIEYGLIDLDSMSIGEFADLDVLVNSKDIDSRVHELAATLYRPVTRSGNRVSIEKYDIATLKKRCEELKQFPIQEVRRAITFFLLIGLQSTKDTLTCLDLKKMENLVPGTKEKVESLINHLDILGIQLLTPLPRETLSNLSRPLISELELPLTSYFTNTWKTKLINHENDNNNQL